MVFVKVTTNPLNYAPTYILLLNGVSLYLLKGYFCYLILKAQNLTVLRSLIFAVLHFDKFLDIKGYIFFQLNIHLLS